MSRHQERKEDITCKYLFYRYTAQNGIQRNLSLPMVHIRLESLMENFETNALIDSGATSTLIPKEMAELLPSLRYEEQSTEVTGAGAVFHAKRTKLEKIRLIKNVTPFANFVQVKVLVPDCEGILPYVILGRDLVFHRFDITFYERRRKITFSHNS